MALSQWYAKVKQGVQLRPLANVAEQTLLDGEQALLFGTKVKLTSHDPTGAPQAQPDVLAGTQPSATNVELPANAVIGEGQLLLTTRRLTWRSGEITKTFLLDQIRALHLPWRNIMTFAHGAAWYALTMEGDSAIKWVAHTCCALDAWAGAKRPAVAVSPY